MMMFVPWIIFLRVSPFWLQLPNDAENATATLIPIVVGIIVAIIILVVIIIFVVRKRRARNNYDAEKAENGKAQAAEETQKLNDNHPDA